MIPFNKPYLTGLETQYIQEAVQSGKISGDGIFTKKCHRFFEERYGFGKCLLTTSCTDALEMAAILIDIQPGDEVIMPSYTFVSTANAFALRGAKIIFADSGSENPNMNVALLEPLISDRTKAIVPVHYAGIACEMDGIMDLADKYGLWVVEDAAQAIDGYYKGKPLGGIGHLGAFSFHETKNIISGEGGMLIINDERFRERAEIIREKGTNRSAFFRGEVDKYGWVDIGSSFLPSEVISAFLYAQLEQLDAIQEKRKAIWQRYWDGLYGQLPQKGIKFPHFIEGSTNNAHMFYLVCSDLEQRGRLIEALKSAGAWAVFHYLSLHKSPYYTSKHTGAELPWSDFYSDTLLRLPLFYELTAQEQQLIIETILKAA
ncbi:dTDP-4-amino-4,6-dideoxygalactose transaminase [Parasegetibacter sp. NRK P23]|uniref:dTDP-4-amino-4,6-dideoxygalactose transaminase n=1 Tax=Parasegetibacter sp. NRK P23 TaxID=2942999 RepID=UPI002042DFCF|nr:dTDP-4-amino-4,6-dideoxygalactose transaminase [Parasegetibacter sp. NRK P23]MCM5527635.1 dTDP-4-amino-4,6-dideoxygalactose transaminase [Parasegetibacter sp. NRK P23]